MPPKLLLLDGGVYILEALAAVDQHRLFGVSGWSTDGQGIFGTRGLAT